MTQNFWLQLVEGTGCHHLGSDARFATPDARLDNRDALTQALDRVFMAKTTTEWVTILSEQIPVAPVFNMDEALNSPWIDEANMIQTIEHPQRSALRVLANPIKLNGQRVPQKAAPELGADTDAFRRDLRP